MPSLRRRTRAKHQAFLMVAFRSAKVAFFVSFAKRKATLIFPHDAKVPDGLAYSWQEVNGSSLFAGLV
jgi:hypothetical protein